MIALVLRTAAAMRAPEDRSRPAVNGETAALPRRRVIGSISRRPTSASRARRDNPTEHEYPTEDGDPPCGDRAAAEVAQIHEDSNKQECGESDEDRPQMMVIVRVFMSGPPRC